MAKNTHHSKGASGNQKNEHQDRFLKYIFCFKISQMNITPNEAIGDLPKQESLGLLGRG
jgi:hypothetical protein